MVVCVRPGFIELRTQVLGGVRGLAFMGLSTHTYKYRNWCYSCNRQLQVQLPGL